jgi:hypothetical protein
MVNFYPQKAGKRLDLALTDCIAAGDRALYAPELGAARVEDLRLFGTWSHVLSMRIGCRVNGERTALYTHIPTSVCTPEGLKALIVKGLTSTGAFRFSREEYLQLLERAKSLDGDSRDIWYIPPVLLDVSKSGIVSLDDALDTTEMVPFLGSVKLATDYLKANRNLERTKIGVWHRKEDSDEEEPQGRLLVFGYYGGNDLVAYDDVNIGRFAGVPLSAAGASEKSIKPFTKGSFLERLLHNS